MRQYITPKDKDHWLQLRLEVVTSTEVSALFGLSPYLTEFELWHQKKNKEIVSLEEIERIKWGTRLESAIAQGIAEDQGWKISEYKDFIIDSEHRIGSSFDFKIGEKGILEIKNVDGLIFRDKWIVENGEVTDAPAAIEMQVQHQLAVSGLDYAYIGALIGGNTVALIKRERDNDLIKTMIERVAKFWASIESNRPPTPDFERDLDMISSIYNVEKGKTIESNYKIDELAQKYHEASKEEKTAKTKKNAAKAELLTLMDNSSRVNGEDFYITYSSTEDKEVKEKIIPAHIQKGRNTFRLNYKGDK